MKSLDLKVAAVVIATTLLAAAGHAEQQTVVKKSASGICHCPGGQFYERTSNFTAFETLADCLASGGREPKRGQGQCAAAVPAARTDGATPYDRSRFGGWSDDDNDCLTTRHEILLARSAAPVELSPEGCRAARGLWRDPYTDTEFTAAAELDIDHLVPLRYAWDRGASRWSEDKRREFANDPANLLPVAAAVNGSKGASGPLDWLPPSSDFACEYLLRFDRVVARYGLEVAPDERARLDRLTSEHCD